MIATAPAAGAGLPPSPLVGEGPGVRANTRPAACLSCLRPLAPGLGRRYTGAAPWSRRASASSVGYICEPCAVLPDYWRRYVQPLVLRYQAPTVYLINQHYGDAPVLLAEPPYIQSSAAYLVTTAINMIHSASFAAGDLACILYHQLNQLETWPDHAPTLASHMRAWQRQTLDRIQQTLVLY